MHKRIIVACGLLRPSFIPERPERELRELTRYRTTLFQQRSAEVNRIQKVLEGANIKLASVASDIVGTSGRAMLEALVGGEVDPETMAALARGRLRDKHDALLEALEGRIGPHQRFLLAALLRHLDAIDGLVVEVSTEVEARLRGGPSPPGFSTSDAPTSEYDSSACPSQAKALTSAGLLNSRRP